jgi:hypothetical protein
VLAKAKSAWKWINATDTALSWANRLLQLFGVSAGFGFLVGGVIAWIVQNFYAALVVGLAGWLFLLMGLLAVGARQAKPGRVPPEGAPETKPEPTEGVALPDALPAYGPIAHRPVRIADLVDRDNKIRNREFRLCILHGPAVLMFVGGFNAYSCRVEGSPEAIFFETSGEAVPAGVVWFSDCTFDRCTFFDVGLAGTQRTLNHYKRLFQVGI